MSTGRKDKIQILNHDYLQVKLNDAVGKLSKEEINLQEVGLTFM
jgi:hypothetical protein